MRGSGEAVSVATMGKLAGRKVVGCAGDGGVERSRGEMRRATRVAAAIEEDGGRGREGAWGAQGRGRQPRRRAWNAGMEIRGER